MSLQENEHSELYNGKKITIEKYVNGRYRIRIGVDICGEATTMENAIKKARMMVDEAKQ